VKTFEAATTRVFFYKKSHSNIYLGKYLNGDFPSVMQFIYSRFSMFFLFENKHIVAVLILAPSSLPSLETAFLQGCKSSQKRYGAP
jgi:hypothetical protein